MRYVADNIRQEELPKLVETCKQYMSFQQDTRVRVMEARSYVRMVFCDASPRRLLPRWAIDESATQPDKPWQYPQE